MWNKLAVKMVFSLIRMISMEVLSMGMVVIMMESTSTPGDGPKPTTVRTAHFQAPS